MGQLDTVERPLGNRANEKKAMRDDGREEIFSSLAAQRFLRLSLGQILLANTRFEEILKNSELTDSNKNWMCESVGKDLNGWFRLAKEEFASGRSSDGAVQSIIKDGISLSFNSQFFGQSWIRDQSSILVSTHNDFQRGCTDKIIAASNTANPSKQIYIAEFQLNSLCPTLRLDLVNMLNKWKVDSEKKESQLGLEWQVTDQELQSYLARDSAIVFLRIVDGIPRGINITFTDIDTSDLRHKGMPSIGGSKASKEWCDRNQVRHEQVMYDYLIATDRDEDSSTKSERYKLLMLATEQSATLLDKDYILAGIRVASEAFPANSALSSHLSNGWQLEDIRFKSAATGATLQLMSRKVNHKTTDERERIFRLEDFSINSLTAGDPKQVSINEKQIGIQILDALQAADLARERVSRTGLSRRLEINPLQFGLSGNRHGVFISDANMLYSFEQVDPKYDRWMSMSNRRIGRFSECLDWLLTEIA